MDKRKRGPYRQYLRQDEPFKSESFRRKIKRRTKKKSQSTASSQFIYESDEEAINFQDKYTSDDEIGQQTLMAGDGENESCAHPKACKDLQNLEDSFCLSESDSCLSTTGSIYDLDSNDSDDNSGQSSAEGFESETPMDNDPPLYEGAPLSLSSSILLILSFVQKHALTGQCFGDLLDVIEAHCPKPNYCKTSVRNLFNHFKNIKGGFIKHLFCSFCKGYICQQREMESIELPRSCEICGTTLANNTSFFLEADFADQVKQLFKDKDFVSGIKHRFARKKQAEENIEDVYDGKLYREYFGDTGFLRQSLNLSFKLNTDGVAIFKSSNFGIWPLFLSINELPPHLRSLKKYRIFSGLWFGENKPFFSTFFGPFIDKICKAQTEGIKVELPSKETGTSRMMVLSGHFDLPARAAVLDQVTHTGYDACCYCTHKGKTISTSARGHVMTYPFCETESGHEKLRTSKDIKENSLKALQGNLPVNGFKAPSPLFGLPDFNIPLAVGIDYMHGICLGVVKTLVGLWFDSSHSGKKWYCGQLLHRVDQRLLQIKPPSTITRVPRSIESHRKHWKAAEYRNWLLFYSLPCMKGILPEDLFYHYALLVGGVYLLCKKSISQADLRKARILLTHFVEMLDVYYAPRYVLLNMHNLLHLVDDVIANGPLWCSSLFVFEDWNGDITNFFHGTQNIPNQIMTAVSCRQNIPDLIAKMPDGQAKELVLKFVNGNEKSNRTHVTGDLYVVGALRNVGLRPELEDDVISQMGVDSLDQVKFFTRLQWRGKTIHSKCYKRVSVRNTYTISYRDGDATKYGQVDTFLQASSTLQDRMNCAAVVLPYVEQVGFLCQAHEVLDVIPVTHIVGWNPPKTDQCILVPIDQIEDICVCIEFKDNLHYIASFPNHIEKD